MIAIIARHESASLFRSMQTWVLSALLAVLFGFWFLKQLELFLSVQTQLATQDHPVGLSGYLSVRYMEPLALAFSAVAPLLAMRSFSDEFRQDTFALWQSSPVSSVALVIGKFMGIMAVLAMLVLLAAGLPFLMRLFVPVDGLLLSSATAGLFLCACACAACGLFFSSLTRHALIAAIATLALLTLLWMLGTVSATVLPLQFLSSLSIGSHVRGFFQGYLQSNDIAYFVLLTILFLGLTIIRLDSLRLNGR